MALLALALAGCGTPGPPQPPSLNLPDQVADLSAMRAGDRVKLTWTMPTRNTDRLPMKTNVTAQVCRREQQESACAPVAHLSLAPGSAGSFEDTLPAPLASDSPRPLTYTVELQNRGGRSAGPSNAAMVLAGEAPAPVNSLAAEVRKSGVVLRWAAADNRSSVRIHRKLLTPHSAPKQEGPLAAPPEPVDQNLLVPADRGQALDSSISFGNTYQYQVQRIARVSIDGHDLELPGQLSSAIFVDAQDVFPPAVPTGLAAVATAPSASTGPSIDLNWEPGADADLAGYYVYRRENDVPWQRISGDQPMPAPAFHDTGVHPGHTYHYAVSAIDRTGHESARSAEAQETVPTS
ncbi:fibronectin type III domain-containing protein [Acidobacteria bacterium AB60]|nr:fibronectin type III domain-containing protein [Acidobacteria bacterium AB60]